MGLFNANDISDDEVQRRINIMNEIEATKAELSMYDYIGTKIAMGLATVEEYSDKIEITKQLRKRINDLEKQLDI